MLKGSYCNVRITYRRGEYNYRTMHMVEWGVEFSPEVDELT